MLETIEKWEYRAKAGVPGAKEYLEKRLQDRKLLPLPGIHGEKIYLTGISELVEKSRTLDFMYEDTPAKRGVKDSILLDAWSSATIEGAKTTVAQVKQCAENPKTKDDRMVLNTIQGSNFAFNTVITQKNIRHLWEMVVKGVCENEKYKGEQYRDGMVVIGSPGRTIHTPANQMQLPELMNALFSFLTEESTDYMLLSFVAHFYFVYIHPFCDGNGRTARILNSSQLYHHGYKKMKSLPLSAAINREISGYYSSLSDSEKVLTSSGEKWLDVTPFVSYMLDAFERCLIDAALSKNELSDKEAMLLERMNRIGIGAEITTAKAEKVLNSSETTARRTLVSLVQRGYLMVDQSHTPYIFRLEKHIPEL